MRVGRRGVALLSSQDPHIIIRLPKNEAKKVAKESVASKQSKTRKSTPNDGAWLSTKPKAVKRKKASAKTKTAKKVKSTKAAKKPPAKGSTKRAPAKAAATKASTEQEVIELWSDDDDDADGAVEVPLESQKSAEDALWDDPNSSDDEFEF